MKMKFKKRNIKISIVSAMLAGSVGFSSANAGTDVTQNLTVNSSVGAVCTIATEAVAFGAYTGAQKDAVGKVKHTCTSQLSADIKIGKGTADSGTDAAPTRKMKNGVNTLAYFLYQDSNRQTIWGNDNNTDKNITGAGTEEAVEIYGRMTENQVAPVGTYTDTVLVTITF
ncbi:MAG TPA: hypothetical protein DCE52_02855 [Rhodobacteraceae bacterium]|nr:hypothetical protein [Paracoccaceae bacterium]